MAWEDLLSNQFISFTAAQGSPFTQLVTLPTSNKYMTKDECIYYLSVDALPLSGYSGNQWVVKGSLSSTIRLTAWRPIGQYCVQSIQTQYWFGLSKCISDGQTYYIGPYNTQVFNNNDRVIGDNGAYYTISYSTTQQPSTGSRITVTNTGYIGCPAGTTTTTTTTLSPVVVGCGTPTEYDGRVSFPSVININLGSGTGTVTLSYNAYSIPDKFIVEFDGIEVINTGYRGQSTEQSYLNDALAIRGLSPETIQGIGTGTITFNKNTATTLAIVKVYAPAEGTAWAFTMSCPVP